MIEKYFAFKIIGVYVGISLVVLMFIGLLLVYSWFKYTQRKEKRIDTYMKSIGYNRILIRTNTMGSGAIYGYRHDELEITVEEVDLFRMSMKKIKKKYKSVEEIEHEKLADPCYLDPYRY